MDFTFADHKDMTFKAADGVLFSIVGAEGVLLSTVEGAYYGLDEVGVFAWTRLTDGQSLESVHSDVIAAFDVGAETVQRDLEALIRELLKAGLIRRASPGDA